MLNCAPFIASCCVFVLRKDHLAAADVRLITTLQGLGIAADQQIAANPAQRLAVIIDFAESMRLSVLQTEWQRQSNDSLSESDAIDVKAEMFATRAELIKGLLASFQPQSGSRIRLPSLGATTSLAQLQTFEPYLRFYVAHQREFEIRLQAVQFRIGNALRGTSPQLARLAAMDEGLREVLAVHIRQQLAQIPQLLGRRFAQWLGDTEQQRQQQAAQSAQRCWQDWTARGGWLSEFYQEMQSLLLAELELRLLPIIGLIEATQETDSRIT